MTWHKIVTVSPESQDHIKERYNNCDIYNGPGSLGERALFANCFLFKVDLEGGPDHSLVGGHLFTSGRILIPYSSFH